MIRLVTDSSCDLPAEIRDSLGITVVPLTVRFGDETFTDGVDLDNAAFWSRLGNSEGLPETAAPSAGSFMDAYDELAEQEADGVVVVTLSSALSATHQSAVIAAENFPDLPVKVVDSRTVSMALGLAAMAGAEVAGEGADIDAVVAATSESAGAMQIFAALDTLEFLRRGGRVGSAQALLGGMLDIKPIITVEDGVVAAAGRVRTRSKARTAIVERALANASSPRMAVFGGGADDIDDLVATIRSAAGDHVVVAELGPVVGTHSGPGTVGIAYQQV
jgi:DegV family protein with EDD domain